MELSSTVTNVLGDEGIVAIRIGNDELGHEACRVMQGLGLNTAYVQRDDEHETGTAAVLLGPAGQPNFTIKELAAWDFLQWTAEWEELPSRADVICFGSLAQRSPASAVAVESFLQNAPPKSLRIFDVNLRQSFYDQDVLRKSLRRAHIVKLNDQELHQVSRLFNMGVGTDETWARRLLYEYGLMLVSVTRGARGSILISQSQTVEHSGFRVKIADAIGAGDVFTACLGHYYQRGDSLEDLSDLANRFASWVPTWSGATPPISAGQLQDILAGAIG